MTFSMHAAVFPQIFSLGSIILAAVENFSAAAIHLLIVFDFIDLHSKLFSCAKCKDRRAII